MTAAVSLDISQTRPRCIELWDGLDAVPTTYGPCVVTIGVFDGVHRGHIRLIERAVRLARERGLPAVLVTFDPHPARVLGIDRDTATLSSIDRRTELVADLGVDAVCVLHFDRALAALSPRDFVTDILVGRLAATAVVVGANFTFGHRGAGTAETLSELGEAHGFTTHPVALLRATTRPCSSSYARYCLRRGDLAAATAALGRPHRVDGFRHGQDIIVPEHTALPAPGNYLARIGHRTVTLAVIPAGALRLLGPRTAGSVPPPGTRVSVDFLGTDA
jgi:riboflavin kinase/FMN adenylyltransferase